MFSTSSVTITTTKENFLGKRERDFSSSIALPEQEAFAALTEKSHAIGIPLIVVSEPMSPPPSPNHKRAKIQHPIPHFSLEAEESLDDEDFSAPAAISMAPPPTPRKTRPAFSHSEAAISMAPPLAGRASLCNTARIERFERGVHTPVKPPSLYETLFANAGNGCFSIHGKAALLAGLVKTQIGSYTQFVKGTFMQPFSVQAKEAIVEGISNDKLLVKLYYNGDISLGSVIKLDKSIGNSIANYKEAIKLGLPVSTIYNINTAQQDGYFLVERIPHEVDVNQASHIAQIAHFFKASFDNKVAFDMSKENFLVREDGTVVLIDFTEKNPGMFEPTSKAEGLQVFFIQVLKSWCKVGFLAGLSKEATKNYVQTTLKTHDLDGFKDTWIDEALEEYFKKPINFLAQ